LGRSSLVLLGAAAVVLAGLSYQRNACYNDEIGLWRDTVAKAPDNPRALVNLALALLQQPEGRASAVAALERALALSPDDVEAVYNLAYCQMLEGRTREAIRGFERAERLRPAYPGVHQALGTLDAQTPGREALAAEEFAAWVRLSPDDPGAHYALGTALAQSGSRLDAAESAFRSALRLDPTFANAHLNLGNLLAARPGRLGEAIDQYQQAIEIDPKLTLAHFNLAMALLSARRLPEAERQLQTVLRLQPDNRLARRYLDRVERLQGRDP
jgi:tetratricopeptide (TPR) repeat protein